MGAGTSTGDAAPDAGAAGPAGLAGTADKAPEGSKGSRGSEGSEAGEGADSSGTDSGTGTSTGAGTGSGADTGAGAGTDSGTGTSTGAGTGSGADTGTGAGTETSTGSGTGSGAERPEPGSRFSLTRDTARPEGGGRAAPGDAAAPVRQWPLLSVLGTIGLGLLIVGVHPFAEAVRVGTILIGLALIGGAVLRRVLPSVGMLAVRSRFTDMLTYGLLGVAIVLLSLMTQPKPWLEIPFLEDIVHSTVP
ncbi:DUF3017 domain-containing protein [Streptomyces sp. NPDC087850]|uniref:DUF3017 domain-containing protein n=1 Tax=Streptomyces sp. NPDC087850 TaxID=3365809 RepID=UPI00381EBAB1